MTNEEATEILKNAAWLGTNKDREKTEEAVNMAIEALRSATDINVATKEREIIHCRDCKFYTSMIPTEGVGICSLAGRHLGDDGFCSEAERREE